MAIIGYDPEKEEVSNDQKIKNCFSLSVVLLVAMPLLGFLLPFVTSPMVEAEYITAEGAQQIKSGYIIIATFLAISIIFTLFYLRRKLKKEVEKPNANP